MVLASEFSKVNFYVWLQTVICIICKYVFWFFIDTPDYITSSLCDEEGCVPYVTNYNI